MSDELENIERRINQYRDRACGLAIVWFVLFAISALILIGLRLSDVLNLIGLLVTFHASIFALWLTVSGVLDYVEAVAERAVYLFTKGRSSIQEED